MTVNKFIRKLLKLKELIVCGYELNERKRELLIFVKPGYPAAETIIIIKSAVAQSSHLNSGNEIKSGNNTIY